MRVVLAEDSALLRDGLASVLERFGYDVTRVGDATDLLSTVRSMGPGELPDIVVTDVRMPPGLKDDGLRAAVELRSEFTGLPFLILSQYLADAYASDLLASPGGAVGYLLKERIGRTADFLRSLELVASGGVVIDPDMVSHLVASSTPGPLAVLTSRERQVLELMARGLSNAQIASELVVTEAAVAKHIGNIFSKLGIEPSDGHRRVLAVVTYLTESSAS